MTECVPKQERHTAKQCSYNPEINEKSITPDITTEIDPTSPLFAFLTKKTSTNHDINIAFQSESD